MARAAPRLKDKNAAPGPRSPASALKAPRAAAHMALVDSATTSPVTSGEHARLTTRAAALSTGVAVFLIFLKSWAWIASSSVAMLASLADSTLDFVASLVTYYAVRYASAPPDNEHRFRHRKAEPFAGR